MKRKDEKFDVWEDVREIYIVIEMKTEKEIRKELDKTMKSLKPTRELRKLTQTQLAEERKKIAYARALLWVLER